MSFPLPKKSLLISASLPNFTAASFLGVHILLLLSSIFPLSLRFTPASMHTTSFEAWSSSPSYSIFHIFPWLLLAPREAIPSLVLFKRRIRCFFPWIKGTIANALLFATFTGLLLNTSWERLVALKWYFASLQASRWGIVFLILKQLLFRGSYLMISLAILIWPSFLDFC